MDSPLARFDLVDVPLECHSLPLFAGYLLEQQGVTHSLGWQSRVSFMVFVPPETLAKHHPLETWKHVLSRLSNHICLSDNFAVEDKDWNLTT